MSPRLKQRIAKLPLPFWSVFYIFILLISVSVLAYVGTYILGDPGTLTVTVNQKSGTVDPNPSYTSVFEVVFSEPIDKATLTDTDITLSGTAPGQTVQSITESGTFDKTTYEVRIEATAVGTITPSIAQELVSAQANPSNTNNLSTSTDNTVTYDGTYKPDEFVTTWKTDNTSTGSTNTSTIRIPVDSGTSYNYAVDWGDGNINSGYTGAATHTYASPGTYTVKISGTFRWILFENSGDRRKIMTIEQWGSITWKSMRQSFWGASNLTLTAEDAPDLSGMWQMRYMFHSASSLTSTTAINSWDVSNISGMECAFCGASSFNSPIGEWDVSSVITMSAMFSQAPAFDQPIGEWDVSSVNTMYVMFKGASSFSQPIGGWDTSSVVTMGDMFSGASSFNQPIDDWDVSNVTTMSNEAGMFTGATSFNQPLNSWDVVNVTGMYSLFRGAVSFDQTLSNWNVSNVTNMNGMFGDGAGLSTPNYDSTLSGWSNLTLQNGVPFDAGTSIYCESVNDRQSIIDNFSWTINDSGNGCPTLIQTVPEVSTLSAQTYGSNQAQMRGITSPRGLTEKGIEYGLTNGYGQSMTTSQNVYHYSAQFLTDEYSMYKSGIAIDSNNNIYVSYRSENKIKKINQDGNTILEWGSYGSGDGQFDSPGGIAYDPSGYIYIADTNNNRIQKFDLSGHLVSKIGGVQGSADGQLALPSDVGVYGSNNIFVVDKYNNRIQKFDSDGNFLSKFGSTGSGNGQFDSPSNVAVDSDGNIFITDYENDRVQKFDSNGSYLSQWSVNIHGISPGVAVDSEGNVYLGNNLGSNTDIRKYSNTGILIDESIDVRPGFFAVDRNDGLYSAYSDYVMKYGLYIDVNTSDLVCGSTYHYRAYATNNVGTGYGEDMTFQTGACTTDLSLNVTLLNTEPVKQNDQVRYKFTAKNEGPNNAYAENGYYIILPLDFSFNSVETAGYKILMPPTAVTDLGSPVLSSTYPNNKMLVINSDNNTASTPFNLNDSLEVVISGTATADYVSPSNEIIGVLLSPTYEPDFMEAFEAAVSNNQNPFTLPYNNVASQTYSYTEGSDPTPNTPPTVSLTSPANNYHFPSDTTSVDIAATASDSDGTISKIRFYLNDQYLSEDSSAPYTARATNLKSGSYSLKAVAYDNSDASTTSSVVSFTILSPGQPIPKPNPPVVAPTEPQTPEPPTKEQQQAFKDKALSLLTPNSPSQVDSLNEQSPSLPEATKYIPWSILALLLATASLLTYTTKLENKRRLAFDKLSQRFKASLEARAIYLQLTSHYIKTPITKMQASLELLAAGIASSTSSAGSSTGSAVAGSSSLGSSSSSTAASANPPVSSSSTSSSPSTMAMSTTTQTMTMPVDLVQSTQAIVEQLTSHANELLDEGQSMSGVQQANINVLDNRKPLSTLTNPWVWLPASLVGLLTILANFLLIQANVYSASVINFTVQMLLWIVGVIALAITYYFYQQAKLRKQIAKDQNQIELETTNRQQVFIEGAYANLVEDLEQLSLKAKDIANYPKTASFAAGLNELTIVVSQLGKVNDLTKYVPGLTWQTNLTNQLATVLSDLQPLADQSNVSTKLNQTTNQTSTNSNVNLPQEALKHLLAAPLKNAIQQSAAGQQVVIDVTDSKTKLPSDSHSQLDNPKPTKQTLASRLFRANHLPAKAQPTIKLTITDQGKGIPKDQLDNLFKPFTSTTSPTQFLDTGIGLDLYLAKVIAEQYGATLAVDSREAEGTRVVLELPQ